MATDAAKSPGGASVGRVRVFCRVRPPLPHEEARPDCVSVREETGVVEVFDEAGAVDRLLGGHQADGAALESRRFEFDGAFSGVVQQRSVFQDVGLAACRDVLKGFNGCILAYGQTGAGKTHSLLSCGGGVEEAGLLPRAAASLFVAIAKDVKHVYEVEVAAMQVYNEQVDDLLQQGQSGQNLTVATGGEISKLTWERCPRPDALLAIIQRARSRIIYAETKMNKASSRSHAVFQIRVAKRQRAGQTDIDSAQVMKTTFGTLSVVDLAGSERVKRSGVVGKEFKEATNINGSLLVLGNVVSALASRQKHVPFRESKLTRILQGSLGGNCKTALLVCVSPAAGSAQETIHALEFASRAMSVVSDAKVNEGLVEISAAQLSEDLAMGDLQSEEQQRDMLEMEKRLEEQQRELAELEQLMEQRFQDRLEQQRLEISRLEGLVEESDVAKAEAQASETEYDRQRHSATVNEAEVQRLSAEIEEANEKACASNRAMLDMRQELADEKTEASALIQRSKLDIEEVVRQEAATRQELEEVQRAAIDEQSQTATQLRCLHDGVDKASLSESAAREELAKVSSAAAEEKAQMVQLTHRLQGELEEALGREAMASQELARAHAEASDQNQRIVEMSQRLKAELEEAVRKECASSQALAKIRKEASEDKVQIAELSRRLQAEVEEALGKESTVTQQLAEALRDTAEEKVQSHEETQRLRSEIEVVVRRECTASQELAEALLETSRDKAQISELQLELEEAISKGQAVEDLAKEMEKMLESEHEESTSALSQAREECERRKNLTAKSVAETHRLQAELKIALKDEVYRKEELDAVQLEGQETLQRLVALEQHVCENKVRHEEICVEANTKMALLKVELEEQRCLQKEARSKCAAAENLAGERLRDLDNAQGNVSNTMTQMSAVECCAEALKRELAERMGEIGQLELGLARANSSLADEASQVSALELRLAQSSESHGAAAAKAESSLHAIIAHQSVLEDSLHSACTERDEFRCKLSSQTDQKAQLFSQLAILTESRATEAERLAGEFEANQTRSEEQCLKVAELNVALQHAHDELQKRRQKDDWRMVSGKAAWVPLQSDLAVSGWAPLFGERSRARAG